jgi:hypothetical protein
LLELREKNQLRTELGHHVFEHLRTQILSRCVLTRFLTLQVVIQLSKECEKYGKCPLDDLVLVSNTFGQLRSENPFHARISDFKSAKRSRLSLCINDG